MQNRRIEDLRNLGPKSARMLLDAGIDDERTLRELGALDAYMRVKFVSEGRASLNLLYALQACVLDRDWRDLSPAERAELRAQALAAEQFSQE